MEYFFMSQDQSSHWYLIPDTKREEWSQWCELDEDDPKSWEAPAFATPLNGSPSQIIFADPKYNAR